ncbi:MAG: UDP-2,4-diacetamido-2,4,6-trideoxy-beta-L-altropyranose hydrolase [Helicobacteraceae bacterium CG2_30_36_10]|nr:MAG: UDP-2,4-diacetamido-2,4,6-trideoxy-beta-L-altropyranose hydrolase [Helicobacteraceae bacterium CG2_30_36_10]
MNILIRADSSSTIGTGHIMRDLVLASRLQKEFPHAKIFFATQNLEGNINYRIIEAGHEIIDLKTNNVDELLKVLDTLHIEMIVIDHYKIDYTFEQQLKIKNLTLKIMVLDDTYEKHNCDILLNHNISANAKKYKKLVPKQCELRCGAEFTLLRDEFLKEKQKKRKKINIKKSTLKIFLAMGGADHSNINIKILKVLKKFSNIQVHLVTTSSNQHIEELKKYVQDKKWIKLHINSNKIAKLMAKSDFAIVTPSVTLNEIYFMEIPFIAIKTAKNQDDMYKYLKKKKFLVLNKFKNEKLKKHVELLLNKDDKNVK